MTMMTVGLTMGLVGSQFLN